MYATISLCLVLTSAALSAAAPYYLPGPQQRQLFYPVVPQYNQYPAAVAPGALPYRQVYYPQAPANLVAPVPSVPQVLRYPAAAAPLISPYTLPNKQLIYYPGPGGTYVLAGDETDSSWQSWFNTFASYFTGEKPAESAESAEKPAESESSAEGTGQKETPTKVSEKKVDCEEDKPIDAKVKGSPQNYVLVGQPQFFGNYGLQRVNPAAVIPSANHGAISSYLLLKNYPGVRFAPQVPQAQVPQAAEAELAPGSAALEYQKLLQTSASRQQKEFEDDSSVTVDAENDAVSKSADAESDKPAEAAEESEAKPEEEETGTTK